MCFNKKRCRRQLVPRRRRRPVDGAPVGWFRPLTSRTYHSVPRRSVGDHGYISRLYRINDTAGVTRHTLLFTCIYSNHTLDRSKFQFQVPHSHRCCDACRRSSAPRTPDAHATHCPSNARARHVDDVLSTAWHQLRRVLT